jgi:4-hydroxy-tetrahydrodipicolinate synthase
MELWGPVLTAMVTPFKADGQVDVAGAKHLARHLVDHGSDGLVVCGTTGEGAVLSLDERLAMWDAVLDSVGDRAAVWASTGSYDTAATRAASRAAAARGVHGLLVVTPYYNKPPQESLYRHFAAVAEAVDLPVMLYNVPSRTGVNLQAETTLRLARDVPAIGGIKEAHGDLGQVADLIAGRPDGFRVLSGDDALTFPLVALGGDGVVSVASHLVGEDIAAMIAALRAGDIAGAARRHLRLLPVVRALFATTSPIPLKAALTLVGLPAGSPRPPLYPASPREVEALRAALERAGVLGDPAVSPAS